VIVRLCTEVSCLARHAGAGVRVKRSEQYACLGEQPEQMKSFEPTTTLRLHCPCRSRKAAPRSMKPPNYHSGAEAVSLCALLVSRERFVRQEMNCLIRLDSLAASVTWSECGRRKMAAFGPSEGWPLCQLVLEGSCSTSVLSLEDGLSNIP
jgi:hypothetical protein